MSISFFSCIPLGRQSDQQVSNTKHRNEISSAPQSLQNTPSALSPLKLKRNSEMSSGKRVNIADNRDANAASTGATSPSFKTITLKAKNLISRNFTGVALELEDCKNEIYKKYYRTFPHKTQKNFEKSEIGKSIKNNEKNDRYLAKTIKKLEKIEKSDKFDKNNQKYIDCLRDYNNILKERNRLRGYGDFK